MSTDLRPQIIDSGFRRTIARNLLRYAVQRQMWCKGCEGILDVRRAHLHTYTRNGHETVAVYCSDCTDTALRGDLAGKMEKAGITLDITPPYKAPRPKVAPPDTLRLAGPSGVIEVPGWDLGSGLGLHEAGDSGCWTLSHLPSGFAAAHGKGAKGRARLRKIASRFPAGRFTKGTFGDGKSLPPEDLEALRVACAEVKS